MRDGGGQATLLILPTDTTTAADRWFVRATGYPGVGSSLAWDTTVPIEPGGHLDRGFRAVIADGAADPDVLAAIARANP
jgi:Methane oxygenase PmoA